MYMPTKILIL